MGVSRRHAAATSGSGALGLVLALLFCCGLGLAAGMGWLPLAVPGLYLAASMLTFAAYAADKSAARSQRWRTPESRLHWLALIGGWPGALLAQKTLRHKSRKPAFQRLFWTTVALNGGALACFVLQRAG